MTKSTSGLGLRVADEMGLRRGQRVTIFFDGTRMTAFEGETVAAALMANGIVTFRTTHYKSAPRGVFCGMGVCFDCLVVVNGNPSQRACMTFVRDGMEVATQIGNGDDNE